MTERDETRTQPPGADRVATHSEKEGPDASPRDEILPETTDEQGIPLDNPSG